MFATRSGANGMQTQQIQLQKTELANEQTRLQIQNLQLEQRRASEEIEVLKVSVERDARQIKEHSTAQSLLEDQVQHMLCKMC